MKTFTELFKETWEIVKSRYQILLSLSLISIVVTFVPAYYLNYYQNESVTSFLEFFWPVLIFLFIAILIVGMIIQVASYIAVFNMDFSLLEILSNSIKVLGSCIWIGFLTVVSILFGFFLFIIPGVIFSLWFMFSFIVLLVEDTRGVAALKRSKSLVSGYLGQIFTRFFMMFLVFFAISFFSGFMFDMSGGPQILGMIVNNILSNLFAPIFAIFTVMVYKNIKELKEGLDILPPPAPPQIDTPPLPPSA